MIRYLLFMLFIGLTPASLLAEPVQRLETIAQAVELFLHGETTSQSGEVVIEVGRIDSRLRLGACGQLPEVFWPDGTARRLGNVTVGVRCETPAWSMFVRARVEVQEEVLLSSRALMRGAPIGLTDVERVKQDITRLTAGYFTDPVEIEGSVLTRPIRAGTVLTPSLLKAASVVERGQRVSILADTGHLQVRMEGEALSDGALGEVIRVRNLSSRQEIEAEVIGPGLVQVRL